MTATRATNLSAPLPAVVLALAPDAEIWTDREAHIITLAFDIGSGNAYVINELLESLRVPMMRDFVNATISFSMGYTELVIEALTP